jgi:hypothetical protein
MDTSSQDGRNNFTKGWEFAELHMPSVRTALSELPAGIFLGFATADAKRDMEQATDLVLEVGGGTIAVRIRSGKYYSPITPKALDWSVRFKSGNSKTEIHKLREGFGDFYFYGYSKDNKGALAAWWLIDLHTVREQGILESDLWQVHPNMDKKGTAGGYFPLWLLEEANCILWSSRNLLGEIASANRS